MGTRWRGLLAPINKPTGDERRMAYGSITHRELPLALKWQRVDNEGHDASVIVGLLDGVLVDTLAQAIDGGWISAEAGAALGWQPDDMAAWGQGELFDDADAAMPRLAEDVAEALHLLGKKVIGPSVDAGAAEAIVVVAGTDDPITDEEMEHLWDSGEEPNLEMLFTAYEIAAATLVAIPAFGECRPFELLPASEAPAEEDDEEPPAEDDEPVVDKAAVTPAQRRALVAAAPTIPAEWFDDPQLSEVTPLTVDGDGRIRGHVAAFGVCHTGIPGVCTTAPSSASDYASFHRYTSTAGGTDLPTAAGRITAGHGAMSGVCSCCPGNDDHACSRLSFGGAVAHHDPMRVLAYVRAGEDEHGIWVAGVVAPEADERDRAALARQRFSGDWREVAGALELTEVLALSRERPGFPLPRTSVANGRQHALVAAGAVRPSSVAEELQSEFVALVDKMKLWRGLPAYWPLAAPAEVSAPDIVPDAAIVRLTRTVTAADGEHTGAMVALVPSETDAARLAVDGGLPVEELHLTLMYLGEAADIGDDVREQIVDAVTAIGVDGPVEGDGFAVSVFNPGDANDRDTAIVLGVGGAGLDAVHTAVGEAVLAAPEQHTPWAAHVTLIESDDASLVAELTDRVGPVVFDRIRVAFGGDVIDIPLGGQPAEEDPDVPDEDVEDEASLADRGALLAADLRAMDAAELAGQLDDELRARDAADLCADLAAIG